MPDIQPTRRYRFGVFEADEATGELRRQGIRVRLSAQPFQILAMLLARPGELLTREEISRQLWPDGTFVDFDHGVNSAVNRIREALGDTAGNPRFVETLARRGYRFVAPVERIGSPPEQPASPTASGSIYSPVLPAGIEAAAAEEPFPSSALRGEKQWQVLATAADLPQSSHAVVRTLFLLLQAMYFGFYVGALANLPEISDLLSPLPNSNLLLDAVVVTAAVLIPARAFLFCALLFRAPGARGQFLRLWPFLLLLDLVWSLAPFLLLHHISFGLALACTTLLVYSPFAQRALVLMGAAAGRGQPNGTVA